MHAGDHDGQAAVARFHAPPALVDGLPHTPLYLRRAPGLPRPIDTRGPTSRLPESKGASLVAASRLPEQDRPALSLPHPSSGGRGCLFSASRAVTDDPPPKMLYLHIGMPKTGTTTLQRLLSARRRELAELGYDYPARWGKPGYVAHHEIGTEIVEGNEPPRAGPEFLEHLASRQGRFHVIVSTESLTNALHPPRLDRLRDFLRSCAEIESLTVILTLRRMDAFFASMYLQRVKVAKPVAPIEQFVNRRYAWMDRFFAALRELRKPSEAWGLALLSYREGGDSVQPVLNAFGLSGSLSAEPARLNPGLGAKGQALLRFLDQFAPALQHQVKRAKLARILESGEFQFSNELHDYDVLGHRQRVRIAEHALRRARDNGIWEYVRAFSDAAIAPRPEVQITPALITRDDLEELDAFLGARSDESLLDRGGTTAGR